MSDKFNTFMGEIVDLDDPMTYPHRLRKLCVAEVRLYCIRELGYALIYMDYLHSDIPWDNQRIRVNDLCRNLADNFHNFDKMYWLKMAFRIDDEIENMC